MILAQFDELTASANPRRGYHDSLRTVRFTEDTPDIEQARVMSDMRAELTKHSMWAYQPMRVALCTWTINYGYDSGD